MQTADPSDLVRLLRARYPGETAVEDGATVPLTAFDWTKMGMVAAACYRASACASLECMLGAVAPPRKAKVQRSQQKKGALAAEIRPDELDTGKQEDCNETSKLTEAMFERIEQHNGQPYALFVLSHKSFAQTVENMFSIAMLIGNAKVGLQKSSEWGMSVHLAKGSTASTERHKGELAQMVINMNYIVWETMKEAVPPELCLTPHRGALDLLFTQGEGQRGRKRSSTGSLSAKGNAERPAKARKK